MKLLNIGKTFINTKKILYFEVGNNFIYNKKLYNVSCVFDNNISKKLLEYETEVEALTAIYSIRNRMEKLKNNTGLKP